MIFLSINCQFPLVINNDQYYNFNTVNACGGAREKAIQSIRFFAGFAHHDFITCNNVLIFRLQNTFLKKQPLESFSWKNLMVKTLDGSITSAFLRPPRQTQHGNSSAGHQYPKNDLVHLAKSRFLYERRNVL